MTTKPSPDVNGTNQDRVGQDASGDGAGGFVIDRIEVRAPIAGEVRMVTHADPLMALGDALVDMLASRSAKGVIVF